MADSSTLVLFNKENPDQVFLVLRSDYPVWVTTGGAIDPGETPYQTALREAREETGLEISIRRFAGVYYHQRTCPQKTYLYAGQVEGGNFQPEYPGCQGRFFSLEKLPPNILNRNREKIFDAASKDPLPFYRRASPVTLLRNLPLFLRYPPATVEYIRKINH